MRSELFLIFAAAWAAPAAPSTDRAQEGRRMFLEVARVLQSPRCMNCHLPGLTTSLEDRRATPTGSSRPPHRSSKG